jgi:acyl-CoA synthetase (AMP-forming)/AMP-acid ligase II
VLLMRNPALLSGYHNLPEKSAQVLQNGWYYSGDVMRRDADGFYYFIGRADDMFVCAGENIYPVEVEKLLEKHPDVAQCSVVPLPDEERAQVPVAFVVRREGASVDAETLKQHALANGPAYQHPRRVCFVQEPGRHQQGGPACPGAPGPRSGKAPGLAPARHGGAGMSS